VSKANSVNLDSKFVLLFTSAVLFLLMAVGWIVSINEREKRAANRFLFLAFLLPLPYIFIAFAEFTSQIPAAILMGVTTLMVLVYIIPTGKNKSWRQVLPTSRIDERLTMFSRNELKPGTENFDTFYKNNPDKKVKDDIFRSKAGLLKPGSSQYNPFQFASADASFETIDALKRKVDGTVNKTKTLSNPEEITTFIKAWSKKLGALDCGMTTLKEYHLYSFGGRSERRGKPVIKKHKYAIAFTVEMDKKMVDSAPSGSIVMESGQQYLESGKIALQVAAFIRNLGFEAMAHIDGNYEVVCPLVARDAGLGEIGRMGILMTPKLGPRVRISVVTTNLPVIIDEPLHDYSVIDFCEKCKKCADACPSQAISFESRKNIDGALRWQINQEACFTLWCQMGTDCGRCISVCPYSHPDNLLHNMVRFGLKQSSTFRTAALKMDDYFYGRKPVPKPLPGWMEINSEK
jgi:reductive dehalogenase